MNETGRKIVDAFDGAAASYDAAASFQKQVAAELIASVDDAAPRTILDIGCGTGFVAAWANEAWPSARLTVLDAAPSMVAATRRKIPSAQALVADATQLPFCGKFDLIVSSMMLHWVPEPAQTVEAWKDLLAPCGRMAVALPVEGSLIEWKALCLEAGVLDRLWPFPQAALFLGKGLCTEVKPYPQHFRSPIDFARSMKETGADVGNPSTPSSSPTDLLRVIRRGRKLFTATYQVLNIHFQR